MPAVMRKEASWMPAFRFLHASDFHLERPPGGVAEAPDHLRELLVEAPYRAANNVFETAQRHEVDFLLLAGDLVAPQRSGPRGVLFLHEQFERLAERKIAVYWASGRADRVHAWPEEIPWPANVHIFPAEQPGRFTVTRLGKTLCEIVGQSHSEARPLEVAQFETFAENAGQRSFAIGMAHGDFEDRALHTERFDYWALGGQHELTLPAEVRPVVHYPGTPQGRSPEEAGPRGCTLVHVTEEGEIRTVPVISDVVRYYHERVTMPPLSSGVASEVEQLLRERLHSLAESNPQVALIVSFTLDADAISQHAQRQLPLPAMIGVLRGEFGYRSPPVWLDRIRLTPPVLPDAWFQQENLLGDLLRAAGHLEHAGDPINLERYLPSGVWREPVAVAVGLKDRERVQAAAREAAGLAAGLLCPEETRR
jgi:DNA repair exonuclease SbcCD nuclease subunit